MTVDRQSTRPRRSAATRRIPAAGRHHDALDGIRALAACAILVFHVAMASGMALQPGIGGALLSRGDVAVPVFFALSGLLLFRPWVVAALDGARPPRAGRYLVRRALRILPLYWVVVVVALALWSAAHLGDVWTWAELLLLAQNYDLSPWWTGTAPQGMEQTWTLAVEAAFYLTLPLVAWVLRAVASRAADPGGRARRLLGGLAVLAVISYGWTVLVFYPSYQPHLHSWLPRMWVYFAVGMALAVVAEWARRDPGSAAARLCQASARRWWAWWLGAAVAYAVAATPITGDRYYSFDSLGTGLGEQVLYTLITACLLTPVALATARTTPAGRLLARPLPRYLGRISYGLFLWQFVIIHLWYEWTGQDKWTGNMTFNLVAVGILTIALAAVTHHLIEEPARRLGRRFT